MLTTSLVDILRKQQTLKLLKAVKTYFSNAFKNEKDRPKKQLREREEYVRGKLPS